MKKRILSIVLAICMVLTLVPTMTFAESGSHTVTVNAGEGGKVSTDGTSWGDSVEVAVNDGKTLNGKVQYKADEGYWIDNVVPMIVSAAGGWYHTVLLDADGNVWTAGKNKYGELGRDENMGTYNANPTFKKVTNGISGVKITAIAAGGSHTVLLDANGNVWTAGENDRGQLGKDGDYTSTFTKVTVGNGVKVKAIAAGSGHTVLLDVNGNVWTAGWNYFGQLGKDGDDTSTFTQITVGNGVKIKAITAGDSHTVLLDANGNVWTAGKNKYGQLGRKDNTGTLKANPTFKQVTNGISGVKITAVSARGSHTVLLDANGNVWTAGENHYGQLGRDVNIGTDNANPTFTKVTDGIGGVKITAIAAGISHTVLLDENNNVWTAGRNQYGQLGRDENSDTSNANPTFKRVNDGTKITAIATGDYHTIRLDANNNVWTAGENYYGQLGRDENSGTLKANPTLKQATVNQDAITFEELLNTPIYNDSAFFVKFKVKYETVYLRKTDSGSEWSFQNNFSQSYHVDSTTIDLRNLSNSVFVQKGWSLDWGCPEIYVQSGDWTLLPATDSEINCSIDGGSLTVQYEKGQTYPGGCAKISTGATLNIQGDGISEKWDISKLRFTAMNFGAVRFISGTVKSARADYVIDVYILGGNINFVPIEGQVVKNGDGNTLYPQSYYFYNSDSDKVISISTPEGTIVCEDEYYYTIRASYDYNKNYMHVWSVNDFDIYYATVEKADGEQYRLLRVPGGTRELQKSVPFYGLDTNPNYRFYRNPDESVTLTAGKINIYENWITIDDPHIIGTLTELGSNMSAEWSYQNEKGEKVVVGGNSLTCTIDDLSDIVNYRTYTCKVYVEDAGGKKEEIGSYSANVYVMRWEQPDTVYAAIGKEVTFTVDPSAETEWAAGILSTLKWQVNKGTDWEDIPNSNTDSYTVTITEENAGYKYRRVINGFLIGNFDKHESGIYIEFTSPELSVTLAPEITSQPQSIRIQENDTTKHSLRVSANNAESYRWQKKVDGTFVDIEGETSSTLEVGVEDAGTYRCVVSNRFGETVSEEASIVKSLAPSCDTLYGVKVTLGEKAQFGVGISNAPGDGSVSVKWQYSADDGATWVDVVNWDDSENISINVLEMVFSQIFSDGTVIRRYEICSSDMTIKKTTADMDGWKVRCVLTDAVGVYYSNTVELTVEIPDYTVTFDTDGGTEIAPKTPLKWEDKVLDGVSDPTKYGWNFIGWKYGDITVTPQTTYKELVPDGTITSIELKAQWQDIDAPTGEISIGTNKWTEILNDITFGLFFKDTQTVKITASDTSGEAVTTEYLLSDKALTAADLAAASFTAYTEEFSINPDNAYVIYAKLTDTSGNVTYLSSDGLVLDGTAPVISGVEDGKTYCDAVTATVIEEYVASVTVNGNSVSLDANNQFTLSAAEGTQTIVVTDSAGNVTTVTVTVKDDRHIPEADDGDCTTPIVCAVCGGITTPAMSHDFSGEWHSDDTCHWHECLNEGCNQTDGKAAIAPERIEATIAISEYLIETTVNKADITVTAYYSDGFSEPITSFTTDIDDIDMSTVGSKTITVSLTKNGGTCTDDITIHVIEEKHNYVNGVCSGCGSYEPPELKDGVYQIKNYANLYWFAALVNGTLTDGTAQNRSANAVLVNDITVNSIANMGNYLEWTPIGSPTNQYSGNFDGQGHKITGLYYDNSKTEYVGLFGFSKGTIKNVGVVGSYFNAKNRVGGVCGGNLGTIENCYNTSTVNGVSYVGGIAGYNRDKKIENCYNTGKISASRYGAGGIVGYNCLGTVKNCFSSGEVTAPEQVGGVCGFNDRSTISNCYYNSKLFKGDAVGKDSGNTEENVSAKTATQFTSGEVAYLLNSGVTDGTQVWYQTLGTNGCPTLDNTCGTVYYNAYYPGCVGALGTPTYKYENVAGSEELPPHNFVDGVCAICGAEQHIVIVEEDLHAEGLALGANTVADCKAELNTAEMYVEIKNISGVALTDTDLVGTGATITYYNRTTNEEIKTVTVVLYGDVNGDGLCDADDYTILKNAANANAKLDNKWLAVAADVTRDGAYDAYDAMAVDLSIKGYTEIAQKTVA